MEIAALCACAIGLQRDVALRTEAQHGTGGLRGKYREDRQEEQRHSQGAAFTCQEPDQHGAI